MTKIDHVDMGIMYWLQRDARMPFRELAERVGVSEATARRRMESLVQAGTLRLRAEPKPDDIGFGMYAIVGMQVDLNRIKAVAQELADLKETRYVGITTGATDIIIEVMVRTKQELLDFVVQTLGHIEGVHRSETSIVMDVLKTTFNVPISEEAIVRNGKGSKTKRRE